VLTLTPCAAAITRTPGRSFLRRSRALDVGIDLGSAELLSLVPGPPQAGAHPLLDHRSLELGEHAHHPEHRLAGRRSGVEALLVEEQVDPQRVQLGQEVDQGVSRPARFLPAWAQARLQKAPPLPARLLRRISPNVAPPSGNAAPPTTY